MVAIHPIQSSPSDPLNLHARALFRAYGQFLLETGSCGTHLPKLEDETATLPEPYSGRGGGLLLALVDGAPAGCIAFRTSAEGPESCEIKRLFVLPTFRGLGLARKLVAEVLTQARQRGFTRAILDTDAATMPAAVALYRRLGFTEYTPQQANLTFLELTLT